MENEKSLFDLQVDMLGKAHLRETAKWARFLAITGFIGLGLVFIASMVVTMNAEKTTGYKNYGDESITGAEVLGSLLGALMIVVLYFFPCYFLLRFANKMRTALDSDDITSLNESFKNLKATFRYLGVVTIIFLVFLLIGLLSSIGDGG